MAVTDSFKTFVVEQLSRVVPAVRAKRMFGGVGLYAADVFCALIDDDIVYFKTDTVTRPDFESLGMPAFRPMGDDAPSMNYHQLPDDVLESTENLRAWAERAIAAAQRAKKRP